MDVESRSIPSSTGIVLNPCCLIHLYASGRMEEILLSWMTPAFIDAFTYEHEELQIYRDRAPGEPFQKETIALEPLVQLGVLHVVTPSPQELADAINEYSPVFGVDSEAYALALANHRNWAIGVDAPTTSMFFHRLAPHIPLFSTLDLLHHWKESGSLSSDTVQATLQRMYQRARYK